MSTSDGDTSASSKRVVKDLDSNFDRDTKLLLEAKLICSRICSFESFDRKFYKLQTNTQYFAIRVYDDRIVVFNITD